MRILTVILCMITLVWSGSGSAKTLATVVVGDPFKNALGRSFAQAIRNDNSDIYNGFMHNISHDDNKIFDINTPIYEKGLTGKGDSLLRIAFEAKQLRMAMSLLYLGADIDAETELGRTPFGEIVASNQLNEALIISIYLSDLDLATRLIRAGADINAPDRNGMLDSMGKNFNQATPLIIAATLGDVSMMNLLLIEGADVHATDKTGKNALHYAAINGKHDSVNILLKAEIDPNALDDKGLSALHHAAQHNRVEVVKSMFHRNFSNITLNSDGEFEINFHSPSKNKQWPPLFDIIPDIKDKDGNTPLIRAAQYGSFKKDESINVIPIFVAGGADINAKNTHGETAFLNSAQSALGGAINTLAANGADVHATNRHGNNAFHLATLTGRGNAGGDPKKNWEDPIFVRLSELGVDINAKNNAGQTPLDIAHLLKVSNPDPDIFAPHIRATSYNLPHDIIDRMAKTLRDLGGKTAAELEN